MRISGLSNKDKISSKTDFFTKNSNSHKLSFKGPQVHVFDGGAHAKNMYYFLKAVKSDCDIIMHEVEIHPKTLYTKMFWSLQDKLYKLLSSNSNPKYIAIPASFYLPLLNLRDQFNSAIKKRYGVFHNTARFGDGSGLREPDYFTPENLLSKKRKVAYFLHQIGNACSLYPDEIRYMDPLGQKIMYVDKVLEYISEFVKRGTKVYLPSGHPTDLSIKWMADQRGVKPELYHYIATGQDTNNTITNIINEIKEKNWYSVNLLGFSDARVVGMKHTNGKDDFIYSARDSLITDWDRGVYNLKPVRLDDRVVGYSFFGDELVDYPYEEFPFNDKVQNLLKYVGKKVYEFVAFFDYQKDTIKPEDKLEPIEKAFPNASKSELDKLKLQGKYVDATKKLFFDVNKEDRLIFKKCDCEGSGVPSVMPFWGSCYAMLNVLAKDMIIDEHRPKRSFTLLIKEK